MQDGPVSAYWAKWPPSRSLAILVSGPLASIGANPSLRAFLRARMSLFASHKNTINDTWREYFIPPAQDSHLERRVLVPSRPTKLSVGSSPALSNSA